MREPASRRGRAPTVHASALLALVTAMTLSLVALGPASALAISRNSVLARAQTRIDSPVKYSQKRRYLGYRTDCSGYVSMCWKTKTSWSTRSFKSVTRRISVSQLKPGDALLKRGYHIRLFYGWVDEAHTQYVAYEAGSGLVGVCRVHSIAEDLRAGYKPTRYRRITDSPASANLLHNGSFDVWARSWSGGGSPVWWQTSGTWWQPSASAVQRKDLFRSARSSLLLRNQGSLPEADAELSQSVPVLPSATYQLTVWATTVGDPGALELSLEYLNAAGESVARTVTSGDESGVDGSTFKAMSVQLASPPDAVRALVTIRLAGTAPTEDQSTTAPGNSVTLDDVSLVRQ